MCEGNRYLLDQLGQKRVLWPLFIVNLLGTIYGFYWYKNQLIDVGSWLNVFVPDSPTASGFFTVVLGAYLLERRLPFVEAFAVVTLFKYGVWAVAIILFGAYWNVQLYGGSMAQYLHWTDWMLLISHGGMAAQAVLFGKLYTYRLHHVTIVAVWTILNDFVDYTLDLHPWLPRQIAHLDSKIGWFTFALSLIAIAIAIKLTKWPGKDRSFLSV